MTLSSYLIGLPIVSELTGKAVNQLPIIHAIFDSYCHGVFPFIQPCWAKWLHNAIDKLSKVKDLIFFIYSGWNSIKFELRSLTLSSTSKEVNTLFLSRIIHLTDWSCIALYHTWMCIGNKLLPVCYSSLPLWSLLAVFILAVFSLTANSAKIKWPPNISVLQYLRERERDGGSMYEGCSKWTANFDLECSKFK